MPPIQIHCYAFSPNLSFTISTILCLCNSNCKLFTVLSINIFLSNVTGFAKIDLMGTNTEIHLLSVDKSHSCTIQRHQALKTRWPGLLLQAVFSDTVKSRGYISWHVRPLRGINKTAWGAKLILTADLASPVSCVSQGHLPMEQHCHLCLSACFTPPTASHSPPSFPPTPYRLNHRYYSCQKKTTSKTRSIQIASRISYEILAT